MKAKTHDYSAKEWGRNYNIMDISDGGKSIRLCGWGVGLSNGDYIILKNGEDTTRYVFINVSYERDPHDMWFGNAKFAPREPVLEADRL